MNATAGAALGLIAGIVVGYGAGRRAERASQAWDVTRAAFGTARFLTGQAVGWMLGAGLLVACAGLAMWVSR